MAKEKLLEVKDLYTYFLTESGIVEALDGVSFDVNEGEPVGIVGESGCGKSVTAKSVLRILPKNGRIMGGEILYRGNNLLDLNNDQMNKVRGAHIALIMQDPLSALNPVISIDDQMTEVIKLHRDVENDEALEIAIKALEEVSIPEPETRIFSYPHEFSGGMRQRILVARALSLEPSLLFADEPTTALDVTIQAQVVDLVKKLQHEKNLGLAWITHNLGLISEMTERVHVFYGGRVVETAKTSTLFKNPQHPYTRALLSSIPSFSADKGRLDVIPGTVPQLINPPKGCRFHPRCPWATQECKSRPPLVEVEKGHFSACFHFDKLDEVF